MRWWVIVMVLITHPIDAEPWGKDADLCRPYLPKPTANTTVLQKIGKYCIQFHQNVISKTDGPRSHFYPSSSQYTLDAMQKHGFFEGFLMGCDRLMRENSDPWRYSKVVAPDGRTLKWDPAP